MNHESADRNTKLETFEINSVATGFTTGTVQYATFDGVIKGMSRVRRR